MPLTETSVSVRGVAPPSQKRTVTTFLFALIPLSLAFDFKGAVGGNVIQYIMAGTNIMAFVVLVLMSTARLPRRGATAILLYVWLVFALFGTLGALLSSVPADQYIRVIFPFLLFAEGLLVAWSAGKRGLSTNLVEWMFRGAVLSLVFTLVWGFVSTGMSVHEIRYQIVSPLFPFLVAYVGYELIIARTHRVRAAFLLAISIIVVAISVTRGFLLSLFVPIIAMILAWVMNLLRGRMAVPNAIRVGLLAAILIALLGATLLQTVAPDVLLRWDRRSLGAENSVTLYTRVAAAMDQWQQILRSPESALLGRGFGNSYHYSGLLLPQIAPGGVSQRDAATPKWFPGEFMWVSMLYYGGLVVGTIVCLLLAYVALRSVKMLAALLAQPTRRDTLLLRVAWVTSLGNLGFLGLTVTANPFVTRVSALYWGLCVGLCLCKIPLRKDRSNAVTHFQRSDSDHAHSLPVRGSV